MQQEHLREQKELLKDKREKLVKAILHELEQLTYQKKVDYKEKVNELPQIDPNDPRLEELALCFQSSDSLVQAIKNASASLRTANSRSKTYYESIIENIVGAFELHGKGLTKNPAQSSKKNLQAQSKIRGDSRGSRRNIQKYKEAKQEGILPSIKLSPKKPTDSFDMHDAFLKDPSREINVQQSS